MDSNKRRLKLEEILTHASQPMKGSELAHLLAVSRQVIVQDIAILRAQGIDVFATPVGYLIQKKQINHLRKVIYSHHSSVPDDIKKELEIIVSHGGKVIDVIVEHPIYGEITANLNIKYINEVNEFIQQIKNHGNKPLSMLTEGAHYHTIEVESEQMYVNIVQELNQLNFIKHL